jgi:RNA-directed DNA polymerase
MKNQQKKHDITQCALYKCRSKNRLAKILQIDSEIFNSLDKFVQYSSFSKDKKDGDQRKITAPNKKLKSVQRRILRLLTRIERPPWVISSQRGKSYIDNGKYHQHSTYLITCIPADS